MSPHIKTILAAALFFVLWGATAVFSQPQPVPRLSERPLDKASYVELAKEWKAYIERNGETAEALVNLGMAYRYSGEGEAALMAGKRAVEIDPDNPKALAFRGSTLAIYKQDMENAIPLLERCREVAPDYEYGLISLATIYQKHGDLEKSEEVLRTIFDQRLIYRPLQDYAYNMLVGLPEGAVLITNGDNDTFPPLALQAGMDFRKDVIVINRHLLRLDDYAEAVFERHPSIKPKGIGDQTPANALLEQMVDRQGSPVYFASSVPLHDLGFEPELTIEGLNMRSSKAGLTPDESARLFLDTYRLDSATDWNFAWDLYPSASRMFTNYVSCMVRLVNEDEMNADTRRQLLDKASEIAEFHDMTRLSYVIKSLQNQ